ncbi:MAG: DUF349 domain-containing protein, partial [Bacteroidota bacterium]|nr:DUF349 domain-containing protein [Bacteroidota bacterium]
ILKQYQRDWFKIGFVPIDKKEAIQSEFMGVVDNHFDKLKVSLMEKKAINFKQKVNSMKENPASEKQIYRERISIENKINRLEENIKLWDNNIGFLANSKKADFLKVEFERKIEKARQEHALLKSELRYINED